MVDIELTAQEYRDVLNWFYLAFAKFEVEDLRNSDQKLRVKLEIMKEAKIEEERIEQE